jgi:hypothetical protein
VQVFAAPAIGDVEVFVHRDSLTPKVQGLGTRDWTAGGLGGVLLVRCWPAGW